MTLDRFRLVPEDHATGLNVLFREQLGVDAHPGLLLGQLSALWGPFHSAAGAEVFRITVVDARTQIRFNPTCMAGSSYLRTAVSLDTLRPVARAFERLLAATPPIECAMTLGNVRFGMRSGQSFLEELRDRRRSPRTAKSSADCLAIAAEHAKQHGTSRTALRAGWQACLCKVLPDPPRSFLLKGRTYENCVGFGLSAKGAPSYAFDEGDGIEELALEKIPWPKPLSPTARLWLTSYAAWRQPKR